MVDDNIISIVLFPKSILWLKVYIDLFQKELFELWLWQLNRFQDVILIEKSGSEQLCHIFSVLLFEFIWAIGKLIFIHI